MASSEQNPTLGTLFHSGEDFLKALGPPESFGVLVLFGEEAIDGGLHFDDGSEHATYVGAARCLVSVAKKASTALSQEAEVGVK